MKWMRRLRYGQRGFTLVELLVAIPIAGIVVAAATAGVMSVANSKDASTHMFSIRQVQTAGYWVSTDGYQAWPLKDNSEPVLQTRFGADNGFPFRLWWTNSDTQEEHIVTYTLGGTVGGPRTLERHEEIRVGLTVISNTNIIVARYLLDSTGVTGNKDAFIFTVTAQVGREPAETRTYNVTLRSQIMGQVGL